ncbi:GNAT family N-acetyltransferase [Gulosibacter chungangensis]|uniref:GNAT family N-acetyltransferase n=1 Tax=Gulosibacter chungangensis TaxID=979746 RepID=A0A7J5BG26_9MICO|nr:GNAT family N-acetyltransferase [Gulosibacter chungangensis]KAB1644842.1 GNAT family N-acetyltransferase [Gulosibacter chungangensis]
MHLNGESTSFTFRRPTEADHLAMVSAIPAWWGTPNATELASLLPRLFVQHFSGTSTLVEDDSGALAGFLVGFQSQDRPEVAYIHFVGIHPDHRKAGLARQLYERFFAEIRAKGCTEVNCVTSVGNLRSQAFHRAMGFESLGNREYDIDGTRVLGWANYDSPGEHRVAFTRQL